MIPQSTDALRSKLAHAAATRATLLKCEQLELEAARSPTTRQLAAPSRRFDLAENRSHEPSSGDFLSWDHRNILGPVILHVQKLLHPEDSLTD